jgi:hypothetical protein
MKRKYKEKMPYALGRFYRFQIDMRRRYHWVHVGAEANGYGADGPAAWR